MSAARVEAGTPLVAAGLSARALSAAQQQLDVSTVGELAKIPAARVQRLRGVGRGPRNELLKRAREWRQQLQVDRAGCQQPPRRTATTAVADPARSAWTRWRATSCPSDTGRNAAEVRVIRLLLALPGR